MDELDKLAAEKIMDWKLRKEFQPTGTPREIGESWWSHGDSRFQYLKLEWQPTRNIAQAFELLENQESWAMKFNPEENLYTVCAEFDGNKHCMQAETAPLAITKACLLACGVEVD